MRTAARSYRAMRRYLANHAAPGKRYKMNLPLSASGEEGEKSLRTREKTVTLVERYPFHVHFRDDAGINICIPLAEAIHLLRGERFSAGCYKAMSIAAEKSQNILTI